MLHDEYFKFPENFTDKQYVRNSIATVLDDEMMSDDFSWDLYTREVSTNISQRGSGLKLIALAEAERLGDNPIVLDVGCSRNHILKHIALRRPYLPVATSTRLRGEHREHSPDSSITDAVNRSLAHDVTFETGVGVDINPIDDLDTKVWVKACTLRPEELMDPKKVAYYDELDDENNVCLSRLNKPHQQSHDRAYRSAALYSYTVIIASCTGLRPSYKTGRLLSLRKESHRYRVQSMVRLCSLGAGRPFA